MMSVTEVCIGTRKSDGLPCLENAAAGSSFCHRHDPQRAEERRRNAALGGRAARGGGSKIEQVARIRRDLRSVAAGVLRGEIGTRAADSIVKALNAELRAVTELSKLEDLADVQRRLTALEQEWT